MIAFNFSTSLYFSSSSSHKLAVLIAASDAAAAVDVCDAEQFIGQKRCTLKRDPTDVSAAEKCMCDTAAVNAIEWRNFRILTFYVILTVAVANAVSPLTADKEISLFH